MYINFLREVSLFRMAIQMMIGVAMWALHPDLMAQKGFFEDQSRVNALRDSLMHRMDLDSFPPCIYDSLLTANSRFSDDTIRLGQVQPDFHTCDDSLSLLFHEYQHFLLQGTYPVALDSLQQPVQWLTEDFFLYTPCPEELERDVESLTTPLDSPALTQLKILLENPRQQLFRYAPSNLAREEIEAYKAQLTPDNQGLYQLSGTAKRAILIRLYQLAGSLERRQTYESQHGLGPSGRPLKK